MSDKKAKEKGKGKGKKGDAQRTGALSVAGHPRARAHVRKAKGWGGLAAFLATAYLSLSHGAAADVAGARALAAGLLGYVVAWACAVMVWRQLMIAELRAKVDHVRAAAETRRDSLPQPAPAEPQA